MKIIFYRYLFKNAKNLTPNEKIVYSFLVSKSIARMEHIFDISGTRINEDALEIAFEEYGNWFQLFDINHVKLSKILNVPRLTIIRAYQSLLKKECIFTSEFGDSYIFVTKELLQHGYIELSDNENLHGDLLIFYSYLKDKSKRYDYCIDTYKSKLSQEFGKTKIAITKLLNMLYNLDLAKRLDNEKLLIK